jgi:hypothetical protein
MVRDDGPRVGDSVSWGTLRDVDLIGAFYDCLAEYTPSKAAHIRKQYAQVFRVRDLVASVECGVGVNGRNLRGLPLAWHDDIRAGSMPEALRDECGYLIYEVLFDALDAIAPDDAYFGASEGDGADFGFWPCPWESDDDGL